MARSSKETTSPRNDPYFNTIKILQEEIKTLKEQVLFNCNVFLAIILRQEKETKTDEEDEWNDTTIK